MAFFYVNYLIFLELVSGQRYGNKYGSDYSVEYVGNLYGYEDGNSIVGFTIILTFTNQKLPRSWL